MVNMNSDLNILLKSCGLSAADMYEAADRLRILGRKVGPYRKAELKAREKGLIALHKAFSEKSCYTCRFHFVNEHDSKLGCTFDGLCHTSKGDKLAWEPIEGSIQDLCGPKGDIRENLNLQLL